MNPRTYDDDEPQHLFPTHEEFAARHRRDDLKLERYLNAGRSNWQTLTAEQRLEMSEREANFWYANNSTSRINLAAIAERRFKEFERLLPSTTSLNMLTLIPQQYAVALDRATEFDAKSLKAWTRDALSGLDYIAIVEAAFYGNAGIYLDGRAKRTVSFHIHAWVWGAEDENLDALVDDLNTRGRALLPGVDVARRSPIDRGDWEPRLRYLWKGQLAEYRIYPDRRPQTNPRNGRVEKVATGRFWQKKQDIERGDAVRMARVMAGRHLDSLIFGGGDQGRALVSNIRREMLKVVPAKLRTKAEQSLIEHGPAAL